jgi:hypothetical protein
MQELFEGVGYEVGIDQEQQCADADAPIHGPVDEGNKDEVELNAPKKCDPLHETIQRGAEVLY